MCRIETPRPRLALTIRSEPHDAVAARVIWIIDRYPWIMAFRHREPGRCRGCRGCLRLPCRRPTDLDWARGIQDVRVDLEVLNVLEEADLVSETSELHVGGRAKEFHHAIESV